MKQKPAGEIRSVLTRMPLATYNRLVKLAAIATEDRGQRVTLNDVVVTLIESESLRGWDAPERKRKGAA